MPPAPGELTEADRIVPFESPHLMSRDISGDALQKSSVLMRSVDGCARKARVSYMVGDKRFSSGRLASRVHARKSIIDRAVTVCAQIPRALRTLSGRNVSETYLRRYSPIQRLLGTPRNAKTRSMTE